MNKKAKTPNPERRESLRFNYTIKATKNLNAEADQDHQIHLKKGVREEVIQKPTKKMINKFHFVKNLTKKKQEQKRNLRRKT